MTDKTKAQRVAEAARELIRSIDDGYRTRDLHAATSAAADSKDWYRYIRVVIDQALASRPAQGREAGRG